MSGTDWREPFATPMWPVSYHVSGADATPPTNDVWPELFITSIPIIVFLKTNDLLVLRLTATPPDTYICSFVHVQICAIARNRLAPYPRGFVSSSPRTWNWITADYNLLLELFLILRTMPYVGINTEHWLSVLIMYFALVMFMYLCSSCVSRKCPGLVSFYIIALPTIES